MDKLAWINHKKKLLTDIFVNKKSAEVLKFNIDSQENHKETENKSSVILESWKDLLHFSAGNNSVIEMTSTNNSFQVIDDDLGQKILDRAINKILDFFVVEYDLEEEDVKSAVVDYISSNNLHKKGLHAIVKKLKNLQLEDLPDLPT